MLNKKSMNILFRCDSSDKIGQGHIRRDLFLAKRLKGEIFFAVRELENNANHLIEEGGFHKIILKDNSFEELKRVILEKQIDFVIFDHYEIDFDFEKKIKALKVKTASFDDTYAPHATDIVINANIFANKKRYHQEVWIPKPLIDKRFFVKRRFFKNRIKKVLIAFGGSDPKNYSFKILKYLPKNWKITIVTTSSNKNIKKLKTVKNIKLIVDSNNMPKLFKMHDLIIISASTLSIEALASKTPFISILSAKNQTEVFKFLKQKRFPSLKKLQKIKISCKEYRQIQKRVINFRWRRDGD